MLALVQTDAELSEILMRAFILRRVELIAQRPRRRRAGRVDAFAGTLRIKEFLTRNGHPYTYIDLDRDADVQELLDRFHVGVADVPVLICRGELVLRNPTQRRRSPTASASTTRSIRRTCATWSSSAPDRRGSRRPSTARRKGSTCWCSSRTRRADRPGRARRSRTTSAFRPASPGRSSPAAPTRRRRSSAPRS